MRLGAGRLFRRLPLWVVCFLKENKKTNKKILKFLLSYPILTYFLFEKYLMSCNTVEANCIFVFYSSQLIRTHNLCHK